MNKIILFFSILFFIAPTLQATYVTVRPHDGYFQPNDVFDMAVKIYPSQPIKAFEFGVSFNASLLECINISEGNLFNEYQTYPHNSSIDNVNGTIEYIYNLIIGQGNTTEEKIAITLQMKIKNKTGESNITLTNVGVTNETEYVNLTVLNGYVTSNESFPPWDFNEDGIINYLDVSELIEDYLKKGAVSWIPEDIVPDGIINYLDVSLLISHYL